MLTELNYIAFYLSCKAIIPQIHLEMTPKNGLKGEE
jgi:hypothetical protein